MRKSQYITMSLYKKDVGSFLGYVIFMTKTKNDSINPKRLMQKAARLARIPITDIGGYDIYPPLIKKGYDYPVKTFIPSIGYIKSYGTPAMPYVDLLKEAFS